VSPSRRGLWDPGAQPERTYQAWGRTALSLASCGLLMTRLTGSAGAVAPVVGSLAVAAALAVAWRQSRRLHSGRVGAAPHAVAVVTALVVVLALAALALVVVRTGG
jgi:putative membrane protein